VTKPRAKPKKSAKAEPKFKLPATVQYNDGDSVRAVDTQAYINAKMKSLKEFGYGSLTTETVAEQLGVVLSGKGAKTVIGHFIEQDITKA